MGGGGVISSCVMLETLGVASNNYMQGLRDYCTPDCGFSAAIILSHVVFLWQVSDILTYLNRYTTWMLNCKLANLSMGSVCQVT